MQITVAFLLMFLNSIYNLRLVAACLLVSKLPPWLGTSFWLSLITFDCGYEIDNTSESNYGGCWHYYWKLITAYFGAFIN